MNRNREKIPTGDFFRWRWHKEEVPVVKLQQAAKSKKPLKNFWWVVEILAVLA